MKFDVVYCDNPWKFRNEKTGGNHKSGASQKYPVMELSTILAMPVGAIVNQHAALFLWVPTRLKFSHGYPCAAAWGFTSYETTIYWKKEYVGDRTGMGFWYRNMMEELLVFTRGDVTAFRCQEPNVKSLPVLEHSEKPAEFRRLIEFSTDPVFKHPRRVELFARKKIIPGWTGIGNAVTGRDIKDDIRLLAARTD